MFDTQFCVHSRTGAAPVSVFAACGTAAFSVDWSDSAVGRTLSDATKW